MKGQRKKKWGGNIAVMSFDALYIEREDTLDDYFLPVRPTRHPRLLLSPKGSCNPAHFGPHPFFSLSNWATPQHYRHNKRKLKKKRGKMMSKSHFFFGGLHEELAECKTYNIMDTISGF